MRKITVCLSIIIQLIARHLSFNISVQLSHTYSFINNCEVSLLELLNTSLSIHPLTKNQVNSNLNKSVNPCCIYFSTQRARTRQCRARDSGEQSDSVVFAHKETDFNCLIRKSAVGRSRASDADWRRNGSEGRAVFVLYSVTSLSEGGGRAAAFLFLCLGKNL